MQWLEKKLGQVTVIINNRDLLEWPRQMCDQIQRMAGLHEIIIIDNGSTNRNLLQWYKECPYKVVFQDNLGHTAPWDSGLVSTIETDLYVVTDPDLDLSAVPDNALIHLANILYKYPQVGKVGLLLDTVGIPKESPYYEHVNGYEKSIQAVGVTDNLFIAAPVDTTFAIYDKRILSEYKICGVRALAPYIARHIPWHITKPVGEFKYYLDNANSKSSSYVWFTKYAIEGPIRQLYSEHKVGKVSSKWSSYFPVYEKHFEPYRNRKVNMLEIGVQNGGSLEIWGRYFKNANVIVGCDANPLISTLIYENPRIKTVAGIASEAATVEKIKQYTASQLDIIIDDGSHRSVDTIVNFLTFFPLLRPGGVFIIEDMHCAYWPEYEGGFFNARSAASFFKKLMDLVNIEHCRNDFNPWQLFQTFFPNSQIPNCLRDGSIYSVAAYNSIYVVEKADDQRRPFVGEVVIAGDDSRIEPRAVGKNH